MPLQVPSNLQVLCGSTFLQALRGSAPAGTKVQVPFLPDRLHALHSPEHGPEQQSLSTQWPVLHCPPLVQAAPLLSSTFWSGLTGGRSFFTGGRSGVTGGRSGVTGGRSGVIGGRSAPVSASEVRSCAPSASASRSSPSSPSSSASVS